MMSHFVCVSTVHGWQVKLRDLLPR